MSPTNESAIVIGTGQSDLATGDYLQQASVEFAILAEDECVGDTWRDPWDSLDLFTPAFDTGLPRVDFPSDDPEALLLKDEMADYLERYAEESDLPVKHETRVTRLTRVDGRFVVKTAVSDQKGDQIVATAAHSIPCLPQFTDETGEPQHTWGVDEPAAGLYFVGLPCHRRVSSSRSGGVCPDVKAIAEPVQRAVE